MRILFSFFFSHFRGFAFLFVLAFTKDFELFLTAMADDENQWQSQGRSKKKQEKSNVSSPVISRNHSATTGGIYDANLVLVSSEEPAILWKQAINISDSDASQKLANACHALLYLINTDSAWQMHFPNLSLSDIQSLRLCVSTKYRLEVDKPMEDFDSVMSFGLV